MPLNTTQLQARIDALRTARDSGVLIVRHGDTSTQFRSLAELNSILANLEAELDAATDNVRSRVRYITQNDKGL